MVARNTIFSMLSVMNTGFLIELKSVSLPKIDFLYKIFFFKLFFIYFIDNLPPFSSFLLLSPPLYSSPSPSPLPSLEGAPHFADSGGFVSSDPTLRSNLRMSVPPHRSCCKIRRAPSGACDTTCTRNRGAWNI